MAPGFETVAVRVTIIVVVARVTLLAASVADNGTGCTANVLDEVTAEMVLEGCGAAAG